MNKQADKQVSITLYHYVHCPFCVRIRMVLGFLMKNSSEHTELLDFCWVSKVLPYDDEKTPTELSGSKMLPILVTSSGKIINESLDIIRYLDMKNDLKTAEVIHDEELFSKISELGKLVHPLAMPYWADTQEFSPQAKQYFVNKKQASKGPFRELFAQRFKLMEKVNPYLEGQILPRFMPYFDSKVLTLKDILIASHLWGLYCVSEYQFPWPVHQYLQGIKEQCQFDYHQDFWKE